MSEFNLLYEPWVPVISAEDMQQKEVSLLDLFNNAHLYKCLAGEMETQNFAILRFLLAVVQTVFSRYDSDGKPIPCVELNEKMQQTTPVDEDDIEEYQELLEDSRERLEKAGRFPAVVGEYLRKWEDRFYLFDEKYPFYQVTKEEMKKRLPKGKKPTVVMGRNINRTISESGNKMALFSPKAESLLAGDSMKDKMTLSEIVQWLIMFQGYTGLSDKVSLVREGQKPSKGWLFDIGGLYIKGNTVFETLLMNYLPYWVDESVGTNTQKPCWELQGEEVVEKICCGKVIDNLAELYTNWSRIVFVNNNREAISFDIVKLPAIEHKDQFLEPMTLWKYNDNGDYKDHYTPKKHMVEQAMWRAFGLIALKSSSEGKQHMPEVMKMIKRIENERIVTLCAVSMQDDGNATSWVPVDEITDFLTINNRIVTDTSDNGWVIRINEVVETTKNVIEKTYKKFLNDLAEIRNLEKQKSTFVSNNIGDAYMSVDLPFREWLVAIKTCDSKEEVVLAWKSELKKIIVERARMLIQQAGNRDIVGISDSDNKHIKNIITSYHFFLYGINSDLG